MVKYDVRPGNIEDEKWRGRELGGERERERERERGERERERERERRAHTHNTHRHTYITRERGRHTLSELVY